MEREKLIITAISSAIGGALLGVLFSPEKGAKTRKNIGKKRDKYLSEIKHSTEEWNQKLKNNVDSLRKKTNETFREAKKGMQDYSEWTKQELYERAKELQVEGYSQMNKSELIEALENHS